DGGIGVSVWYRWTAPASGAATFDTAGSAIDTILEVWDACPNSPSTLYAYNDDTGASTTTSRITFAAAGGATYFIRIDSRSEGSFALAWSLDRSPPPANDDFAAARPLAASPVRSTRSTRARRRRSASRRMPATREATPSGSTGPRRRAARRPSGPRATST